MTGRIEARLAELGIELPSPASPAANYVPFTVTGNLVYVSAQGPVRNGVFEYTGEVGADLSIADGQAAARLSALNVIAQLKAACGGDLDRVRRIVKLVGWVHAGPGFTDHAQVVNGASDLMVEVFGDAGRHARAVVGSDAMPFRLTVGLDAVAEIA